MAVNHQFVAVATAHYAKAGFARRVKHQRRMAQWPQDSGQWGLGLLFLSAMPQGWSAQHLGVGPGYNSGGQVVDYDHLAVTAPNGVTYPAYKLSAGDYCVCQELNYVPAK